MVEKHTQYITIALAVIIIIAVGVIIYTNLPQGTKDDSNIDDNSEFEESTFLNVTYNQNKTAYTLEELQEFETLTGQGGKRTNFPQIRSKGNYTGVVVTSLVENIAGSIDNYSIKVIAKENGEYENQTFNFSVVQGNVNVYNETNASHIVDTGNVTMILAYQFNGSMLDVDDGNLMVAFVDENEMKVTSAYLWWKFVEGIEIIPQ